MRARGAAAVKPTVGAGAPATPLACRTPIAGGSTGDGAGGDDVRAARCAAALIVLCGTDWRRPARDDVTARRVGVVHRQASTRGKDVPRLRAAISEARRSLRGVPGRVAAESMRRAATERMEQVRAEEAHRRRVLQLEEEERRQQAAREEEAWAREIEDAPMREEDALREREQAMRRSPAPLLVPPAAAQPSAVEDAFDPYAVLGVSRDAPPDDLRARLRAGALKGHDHDSVAHLGVDVQEHFRKRRSPSIAPTRCWPDNVVLRFRRSQEAQHETHCHGRSGGRVPGVRRRGRLCGEGSRRRRLHVQGEAGEGRRLCRARGSARSCRATAPGS